VPQKAVDDLQAGEFGGTLSAGKTMGTSSVLGLRFDLGEDIAMLRGAVRAFARTEIAPRSAEIDRTDQFPTELWRKMGEIGAGTSEIRRRLIGREVFKETM
jgi:Acyl-CoA dehydrogenase, N-terminal domain